MAPDKRMNNAINLNSFLNCLYMNPVYAAHAKTGNEANSRIRLIAFSILKGYSCGQVVGQGLVKSIMYCP